MLDGSRFCTFVALVFVRVEARCFFPSVGIGYSLGPKCFGPVWSFIRELTDAGAWALKYSTSALATQVCNFRVPRTHGVELARSVL